MDALKNGGYIDDVDEEYAKILRDDKRKKEKKWREDHPERVRAWQERAKIKKAQLKDPNHNPDKNYAHVDGAIAGVKKGKPMTHEQADSGNVNPYYKSNQIGYRTNCQTCVATYAARLQGYDVRALPNLNNRDIWKLSLDVSLAYVDKNGNHPKSLQKPKGIRKDKWLEQNIKNGDVYALEFGYSGKDYGHVVIAQRMVVKSGKKMLRIYDPQNDRLYNNLRSYLAETRDLKLTNLTNCKIDEKFCDRIMIRSNKK